MMQTLHRRCGQCSGEVTESLTVGTHGTIWSGVMGRVCGGLRKVCRAQDRETDKGKGKVICNSAALENH